MKALVYSLTPSRWVICKLAGFVSRRAFYGAISPLRLREVVVPSLPGPEWVRLRTVLGGVCGTDLVLVTQRNHPATLLQNFARFPAVLGHENVALVDAIGPAVSSWRQGQRVCVEPAGGCYSYAPNAVCPQCAEGRPTLCERGGNGYLPPRALLGLNPLTGGSWGDYFVAHQSQVHAVPDGVSDDEAVLVDPLASAAHAVLRRPPRPGESVLVTGVGIMGLGLIAAIRALGHENAVTAVARHPFQADLAKRLGATDAVLLRRTMKAAQRYAMIARSCNGQALPGRFGSADLLGGFDLTFDCTGNGSGLSDAFKWTRSRGVVVVVGTSGIAVLDTTSIWFNELEIIGANGRQMEAVGGRRVHTYDLVLDWLAGRRIDLTAIHVSRFRLADYRTAFAQLLGRGRHAIVKAAFEP
ncbi:MAG TPA: alcohol dehydrogenase catalytic domain-containing protein [Phycisphaerae bacterium]|nr:alcohol dehydrogenase catalytic domain-containing protein [Phycisphaerae bacterium]